MTIENKVLFLELNAGPEFKIAVATLNTPKTLNALDIEMIGLLHKKLLQWKNDDRIACVFLQGAGEKSFCAGGDVVSLYRASAAYGEELTSDAGLDFFTHEYRLDYLIHTYPKPIIVWGSGIVMGGGLGLMCGAGHRIVTDSTYMSMPEVTIGLYPDVGATWFLNRAPEGVGMFLGMTGASMNAADAIFAGLADGFVSNDAKDDFVEQLKDLSWTNDKCENDACIRELISNFQEQGMAKIPVGNLENCIEYIQSIAQKRFHDQVFMIARYDGDNHWLAKAASKLKGGCPITPYLVREQMEYGKNLSLKEVFQFELILSANSLRLGHFKEGVRALLIDKDCKPEWQPSTFDAVSQADVEAFLTAPWSEGCHPLADLKGV